MEDETKCYCGHTTYCDCGPEQHVDFINSNIDEFDKALKLYKQETLEEVAKKWNEQQTTLEFGKPHNAPNRIKAFIEGAKWQKEQYTIEEQHVGHTIDELDKEYIKGFNEGSAYYIERSYSEEEVIAFAQWMYDYKGDINKVEELLKEFKKK